MAANSEKLTFPGGCKLQKVVNRKLLRFPGSYTPQRADLSSAIIFVLLKIALSCSIRIEYTGERRYGYLRYSTNITIILLLLYTNCYSKDLLKLIASEILDII